MNTEDLQAIRDAVHAQNVRISVIESDIKYITKTLEGIARGVSWLPKTVGGILVAAISAFVLKGGLGGG